MDINDIDNDGDVTDSIGQVKSNITVARAPSAASLESIKWVRGELDVAYTKFPDVGETVPGGIADYQLIVTNPNATPIDDIVIIDILPYVSDVGVLDTEARLSEWRPNLAAAITPPAGITVEYSTETNPCRNELAGSNPTPYPSGCSTPNWSSTPPANITTVQALRFDFGTMVLNQGESVTIDWPMRVPVSAPTNGEVAWNSFGWAASRADNSSPLLPSEPIKVGIRVNASSPGYYGDKVWNDLDADGYQDAGEPGVDGISVELFEDDGDDIAEPGGDDVSVRFTTTADGGLYLFPNLPAGDYFAVFSNLPSGFSASPTDATSNDEKDSDGITTEVTSISSSETDLDWDLGIIGPSLPGCSINITNVNVSPCVNNGGIPEATVDVTVTWSGAPPGENIMVTIGDETKIIDVIGGTTSPAVAQLTVIANGTTGNDIYANFSGGLCLDADGDNYDAPSQCTEICGNGLDEDGDGLIDNADTDCPGLDPDLCWIIADMVSESGTSNDELYTINPNTGALTFVGYPWTNNIESMAIDPLNEVIYAINKDDFGIIDPTTGIFSVIFYDMGNINGSEGIVNVRDVDGLTYDINNNILWASERRDTASVNEDAMPNDLLFQIDPATGMPIADAFGVGIDYLLIATNEHDLDDLAMADDGTLYAISNYGSSGNQRLGIINTGTGAFTEIGDYGIEDVEGLGLTSTGQLIATTGISGTNNNSFYSIDPTTAVATYINSLLPATDVEACACRAGNFVNSIISGTVWMDNNTNGLREGGETLIQDMDLNLLYSDGSAVLDNNGNPISTMTDASGFYQFDKLPAGTYKVELELSNGSSLSPKDIGADDTIDSDFDPSTLETDNITLVTGQIADYMDAGVGTLTEICSNNIDDDGDGLVDCGDDNCPSCIPRVVLTVFN